jgi:septum formation protein
VAFENFLLAIGGHIEASDMVGDEASLSVLRAKGQRLGFSPQGHHAFAQIQKITGLPDVGTAFASKRLSSEQLLDLRLSRHAQALRDWFAAGTPSESADETALRLAQAKAEAVATTIDEGLIIGSDQVATLDGQHIGKPGSHANAMAQLQSMRGREVVFHTALCLLDTRENAPQRLQLENIKTVVMFRDLPDAELDAYLRIEQPYDCAGSAKNEALGIALLSSIQSDDPTALTGLPLIALVGMLRKSGLTFFER